MLESLDRLPIGVPAVVMRIGCSRELGKRLADFGLVQGTEVMARYRSPDKGVTALEFRGTVLALRTRDLKGVRVQWR
jgi:Fe2+ transport system protein FeoA